MCESLEPQYSVEDTILVCHSLSIDLCFKVILKVTRSLVSNKDHFGLNTSGADFRVARLRSLSLCFSLVSCLVWDVSSSGKVSLSFVTLG